MKVKFFVYADAGYGEYESTLMSVSYPAGVVESYAVMDAGREMDKFWGHDWRKQMVSHDVVYEDFARDGV